MSGGQVASALGIKTKQWDDSGESRSDREDLSDKEMSNSSLWQWT